MELSSPERTESDQASIGRGSGATSVVDAVFEDRGRLAALSAGYKDVAVGEGCELVERG
jgi:hypothetical protein